MNKVRFLLKIAKTAALALALAFSLIVIGCARQKFLMEDKEPTAPTYKGTSHFIFWGIGQTSKINTEEVCGLREVSAVEGELSFLNGVCQAITWGIYLPVDYKIYCKKEKNYDQNDKQKESGSRTNNIHDVIPETDEIGALE